MRELTALEIEQFDFTGRVPELNLRDFQNPVRASSKQQAQNLKARTLAKFPRKKRRAMVSAA